MGNEYIPLSGEELLEVIFRKGKEAARAYSQHFGKHLAFHNPHCQLAIKVDCHTPEGSPDVGGFELVVPLGGMITEPDRVRDELGLGTYETRLVDEHSGVLADVKINERKESPSREETIAKVNKIIAEGQERAKKPRRSKPKRRGGWPKGKPRGKKETVAVNASPVIETASVSDGG